MSTDCKICEFLKQDFTCELGFTAFKRQVCKNGFVPRKDTMKENEILVKRIEDLDRMRKITIIFNSESNEYEFSVEVLEEKQGITACFRGISDVEYFDLDTNRFI